MTTPHDAELDALAAGELDDEDAGILSRIERLFSTMDPVPAGLVDRINFGITLDALEAEVAELQRSGGLAGVRTADSDVQSVTFTTASLTTMITVTPVAADRVRIDGWIAPGAAMDVELRMVGESRHSAADIDGRFVFDDVPRGLAQFVLRPPGDATRPIVTPSIEI
jgi:hypothetical protein